MSHGSQLRVEIGARSREQPAKKSAERHLPEQEQSQASSFAHHSASNGAAVRQKAGFVSAAPTQTNSRLKQIPAAVRHQV